MYEIITKWCHKRKINLGNILLFLAACIFVEIFGLYTEYRTLNLLTEEPSVVEGTFTGAYRITQQRKTSKDGYRIYLNHDRDVPYILMHQRFDKRTYGLKDNVSIEQYGDVLNQKIGYQARIEYIQMAENSRWIVRLKLEGIEYVDTEQALKDMRNLKQTYLYALIASFLITIAILIFILKCMRWQKSKPNNVCRGYADSRSQHP